jgi:hypothetical protein
VSLQQLERDLDQVDAEAATGYPGTCTCVDQVDPCQACRAVLQLRWNLARDVARDLWPDGPGLPRYHPWLQAAAMLSISFHIVDARGRPVTAPRAQVRAAFQLLAGPGETFPQDVNA